MAKLLKLRFLDLNDKKNDTYIEVYCDENNKRGYFRKINKELAKADDTTIRPTQDKFYEVRLLGVGWRTITRDKLLQQLKVINRERVKREWPEVKVPDEPAPKTN